VRVLSEENEWKKFLISEEVMKLMEEIEEKAKNPETQLEALELIEANIEKLPYKARMIVLELTKSKDEQIREKAEQVMEKYYEKFPQLKQTEELLKKWAELNSRVLAPILAMQSHVQRLQKLFYSYKLPSIQAFEYVGKLSERMRLIEGAFKSINIEPILKEMPPLPEVVVLRKITEVEQKIDDLRRDLEELKEAKQIEKEEYERLKKKLKELEEELDKAYQ